jgi:hypothetical protein
MAMPTYGATVTPTLADLATATWVAVGTRSGVASANVGSTSNTAVSGARQLSNDFLSDAGGVSVWEISGLALAIGAGDTFELDVFNSNLNPWTWTIEIFDAGGSIGTVSVAPGVGTTATALIAYGGGGTTITDIELRVSGAFAGDANADANFSPVPEPTTMLLTGIGLLGGAGVLRRRNKS